MNTGIFTYGTHGSYEGWMINPESEVVQAHLFHQNLISTPNITEVGFPETLVKIHGILPYIYQYETIQKLNLSKEGGLTKEHLSFESTNMIRTFIECTRARYSHFYEMPRVTLGKIMEVVANYIFRSVIDLQTTTIHQDWQDKADIQYQKNGIDYSITHKRKTMREKLSKAMEYGNVVLFIDPANPNLPLLGSLTHTLIHTTASISPKVLLQGYIPSQEFTSGFNQYFLPTVVQVALENLRILTELQNYIPQEALARSWDVLESMLV